MNTHQCPFSRLAYRPVRYLMMSQLVLALLLGAGCRFDADYQYDIRFPATLILVNETESPLVISSVLSLPTADSTFVLNGGTLAPGDALRLRISARGYQVLLDGAFVVRGSCGGRESWEVLGSQLARQGVQDSDRWDLTVPIRQCMP